MQDEGVERYGGTKDVADSHKFDEKNLEAYLAAHVEGFEGPMEVRHSRAVSPTRPIRLSHRRKIRYAPQTARQTSAFCPRS